ncbi:hypothetical protein NDI47_25215 [Microcoleus vaginatus GB1-A2]|uniref:hypothetical protein n=1 Tax=Microcoleus vaginatus TaxID=119532 RepID=UPI0016860BC2|nr:hypothetical protein [Microcoleus sp. FACHB-61]
MPCFASSENCEKSGNIIYIRRKKEEGRRKKAEGRGKMQKEEGRRKRENAIGNNFSD